MTVEDELVDLADAQAALQSDSYIPLACTEIMLPQPCGVQCPLLLLPSTAYALYGGLAWRLNAGKSSGTMSCSVASGCGSTVALLKDG